MSLELHQYSNRKSDLTNHAEENRSHTIITCFRKTVLTSQFMIKSRCFTSLKRHEYRSCQRQWRGHVQVSILVCSLNRRPLTTGSRVRWFWPELYSLKVSPSISPGPGLYFELHSHLPGVGAVTGLEKETKLCLSLAVVVMSNNVLFLCMNATQTSMFGSGYLRGGYYCCRSVLLFLLFKHTVYPVYIPGELTTLSTRVITCL